MVAPLLPAGLQQESDSEGDVPEQVTLSSGREEAQTLRKQERENQRIVQAEAKQRRQRRTVQKKEQDVPLDEPQETPNSDSLEEDSANPAKDEEQLNSSKSMRVTGFLDASIVDFLSAQEKKVVENDTSTQEEDQPHQHKRAGKRKGREAINSSSRVKVVMLEGDRPTSANRQSALSFKQNRLYGDHVHRSLSMLPRSV